MEEHDGDVSQELFLMQKIYGTLFSLSNRLQALGDGRLRELTTKQLMVIVSLLQLEEGQENINNIAQGLGTSKQNAAHLVKSLAKKGHVVVERSRTDRRSVSVLLTDKGGAATEQSAQRLVFFLADIFADFSIEELEVLWHLLHKLYRGQAEAAAAVGEFSGDDAAGDDISDGDGDEDQKLLRLFRKYRSQGRN